MINQFDKEINGWYRDQALSNIERAHRSLAKFFGDKFDQLIMDEMERSIYGDKGK
jgi:hypothetical protein